MSAAKARASARQDPEVCIRTQVAIIGGGPAGLFLAHLLRAAGIDAVVIERKDRTYIEGRVRAGVLEPGTADVMDRLKLGERMRRQSLAHGGTNIVHDGERLHIDLQGLTGKEVLVYGQQEVMKDLFDAAEARGLAIVFDAGDVRPHDVDTDRPFVTWTKGGVETRLDCDFVVGCDGYHGVSRACIPASRLQIFERVYPFGWLGVLADVPPCDDELIYANHGNGFALASMRSASRSRYYIQCPIDDAIDRWTDDRFWDQLCVRLGPEIAAKVTRGPSFEKTIAPLRTFVAEPMRYGALFLAGDAAHIVPPTGAKGMNLAVSDVVMLAEALETHYAHHDYGGIDGYSARALARVWRAERFSWWLTALTHRFPETGPLERRLQVAELDYIKTSAAARMTLAENYVGLPLEALA